MWQIGVFGILVHLVKPMIWVRCSSDGYRLPGFTYVHAEDPHLGSQFEGRLMSGYQEVFGCALYLLGNLCERKSNATQTAKLVCALEIKEGEPTDGKWIDFETASPTNFALEEHGRLVKQTFVDLIDAGRAPRQGRLWNRRGMLSEAATWIRRELARLGHGPVVEITQKRWSILRVQAEAGVFYFKAPADVWGVCEPVVADLLGRLYPQLIPKPTCIDPNKGWMLTPGFGETLEHAEKNGDMLVKFAHRYGRMQLDSSSHTGEVAGFVKLDFDMEHLPAAIEAYVKGDRVAQMLEPVEVLELRSLLPRLLESVDELRSGSVPQTIVHADLGPHNLAQYNGEPIVYDWSTAGLGFPFFDMVELLHRVRPSGAGGDASVRTPQVDAIKLRMKEAYLEAWSPCASPTQMARLWNIAEPLGFMSMGLHLPFPYFPRRVLQYMRGAA